LPKRRNGSGGSIGQPVREATAVSLVVSEKQLDEMFLNWPLEDKVGCVQAWLDGREG
jgi:hypothetical protein